MKILVATDKFKGSMTAAEACASIAAGIRSSTTGEAAEIEEVPIADGGEGMAEALVESQTGQWIEQEVSDPLGLEITAKYGLIDQGKTAVIEMAEASGLWRLGNRENDPWRASTFGTGQLIRDAIHRGVSRILLGIGGSATNDGGTGVAQALGYRFLDSNDREIQSIPADIEKAVAIDSQSIPNLPKITVACDVTNPLLGPNGCTPIYGPQKGIDSEAIPKHESRLRHLVDLLGKASLADIPGAGAAGGLGFGCLAFLDATLKPGFEMISESLDLPSAVSRADLVITGEGKLDGQSLQGKAPAGVASLAKQAGKTSIAFCGVFEESSSSDFSSLFDEIHPIDRGAVSVAESIQNGPSLLYETARKWASGTLYQT